MEEEIVLGTQIFVYIILRLILANIPSMIARYKGYDAGKWYLYGFFLFIIALIHSLVLEPNEQELISRKLADGMHQCPYCKEIILPEATVCRYCGRSIEYETYYLVKVTPPTDAKARYHLSKKLAEQSGETVGMQSKLLNKGLVLEFDDMNKAQRNMQILEKYGCSLELIERTRIRI